MMQCNFECLFTIFLTPQLSSEVLNQYPCHVCISTAYQISATCKSREEKKQLDTRQTDCFSPPRGRGKDFGFRAPKLQGGGVTSSMASHPCIMHLPLNTRHRHPNPTPISTSKNPTIDTIDTIHLLLLILFGKPSSIHYSYSVLSWSISLPTPSPLPSPWHPATARMHSSAIHRRHPLERPSQQPHCEPTPFPIRPRIYSGHRHGRLAIAKLK